LTRLKMSSRCRWNGNVLHGRNADCYMQELYDDTCMHIFKNTPYSTDPENGKPLASTLIGVDEIKMLEFGLNHRVCNVECTIDRKDVHVLEYRPESSTELWTLMRNVYHKWERLHDNNGSVYWPCKSQAADLIVEGGVHSLRCLKPTRFDTGKHKMAQSLLDLLTALTTNYFCRKVEEYQDGNDIMPIYGQKVRKIECNPSKIAREFFENFHMEKYQNDAEPEPDKYYCNVKRLIDQESRSGRHKLSPSSLKHLFHSTIADVFSTHKGHVHMLLCHRFLVEDPQHCETWLQFMLAFADNRLLNDGAQVRLTAQVKYWKQQYDPTERRRRARKRGRYERYELDGRTRV